VFYAVAGGAAFVLAASIWYVFTYTLPRDEDSVASRMTAYRAALELLPRYAWLGTGLDASDRVIASTDWGAKVRGATVHSVPFKLLLETGIAGFVAFVWGCVTAMGRVWKVLFRSDMAATRRLGATALAVGFAVLALAFVQPFMALPLYPVAFGLIFGPIAFASKAPAPSFARRRDRLAISAALLVGPLVVCNVALYHLGAPRVIRFVEALEMGPAAEREGRWGDAAAAYRESLEIARAAPTPTSGGGLDAMNMAALPGYDALAHVIDLHRVYYDMAIGMKDPHPEAAAALGLGRALATLGDPESAASPLREGAEIEPHFADPRFELAELYWRKGQCAAAVAEYANAARAENDWRNLRYREQMARLDTRIEALAGLQDVDATLERARLLRKRGRWNEAATLYREVEQERTDSAEAIFGLGVDAAVNGRRDVAVRYFERALVACPTHIEARAALDALSAP
jgi:tetratricopeptide (TPR) repeat protein